jgi:hypothetical protein
MSSSSLSRRARPACRWSGVVLVAVATLAFASPGRADEESAKKILQNMSEYIGKLKQISADFDSTIEIVTPDVQKIQFASSGSLLLSRPDKLRITRTGGYTDVELVYDGKQVSLLAKNANVLAQTGVTGTIDAMVDTMYEKFNSQLPGMDLLLTDSHRVLTTDVIRGAHIGQGVIEGAECEHLAFRGVDTDWQIWIEAGDKPIPRKYVITSKTVASAPQYVLTIRKWKSDEAVADNAFVLSEPQGVKKVALESFAEFDEVPPGIPGRRPQ